MTIDKKVWSFAAVVIVLGVVLALFNGKKQMPVVSSDGRFHIQTWNTDNGAKVMYVRAPQLPMVDIRLVFDAGSARDGDKPGLAQLTNGMLSKGAGDWDTDALAERFDSIGAVFGTSALRDMAVVKLRSLNDELLLEKAVATMSAVVSQPQFEEKELERIRKQMLIAIKAQEQSPGAIGDKAFYKALYGEHPYAAPSHGTEDSVKNISRKDLKTFYKNYYVGRNAVMAIVGDVDLEQAKQLAERIVGQLPAGEHAAAIPSVAELSEGVMVKKDHPSTQTHILVGQPGMRRGDPDYFTLYVGNHILGGSGFSSRVVEEIREKRGLAYSSYSYFIPMRENGPFQMGLQTGNGQRDEALTLLNQILDEFIEEGPTQEELQHAKKNITGGFPLRIDSNKDIIEYIAMIGFYDMPLDYLDNFNSNIEAITTEQIKDAFARRIHPDKLVTVLVGQESKQAQ